MVTHDVSYSCKVSTATANYATQISRFHLLCDHKLKLFAVLS